MTLPTELWNMILKFKASHFAYQRKQDFIEYAEMLEEHLKTRAQPTFKGAKYTVMINGHLIIYYLADGPHYGHFVNRSVVRFYLK